MPDVIPISKFPDLGFIQPTSPLQAMGAMPITFHYSVGFVGLMWQFLIIIVVFTGIILTPTVVAMDEVGK